MSSNVWRKNLGKQKYFFLSPSNLSEEDLELYIAGEIEEMKKYFSKALDICQKGISHCGKFLEANSSNMLEKVVTSEVFFTNEMRALRTKIELTEAQYHTFVKEIEKQSKGTLKIKEKPNLKKKMKELETVYTNLMKTLRKQLQNMDFGTKQGDVAVKVDASCVQQNENGISVALDQNNTVMDIIPITAAKINTVLEQMNAVNEDIDNLRRIKNETDKYLQNLKCTLKNRINPYNKGLCQNGESDELQKMSVETAGRIMSQIERYIHAH